MNEQEHIPFLDPKNSRKKNNNSQLKKIYNALQQHLLKLPEFTGASQGLIENYGVILNCTEKTLKNCKPKYEKLAFEAALGFASLELLFQACSLKYGEKSKHFQKLEKWRQGLMDIVGSHTFYLLAGSALAALIAGKSQIDDSVFLGAVVAPSLALGIITPPKVRYAIFNCDEDEHKRTCSIRITDTITSYMEGFTTMAGLITAAAGLISIFSPAVKNQIENNDMGYLITKYAIATAWAGVQIPLACKYSPFNRKDTLSNIWTFLSQTISTLAFFAMSVAFLISQKDMWSLPVLFTGVMAVGAMFSVLRLLPGPEKTNTDDTSIKDSINHTLFVKKELENTLKTKTSYVSEQVIHHNNHKSRCAIM